MQQNNDNLPLEIPDREQSVACVSEMTEAINRAIEAIYTLAETDPAAVMESAVALKANMEQLMEFVGSHVDAVAGMREAVVQLHEQVENMSQEIDSIYDDQDSRIEELSNQLYDASIEHLVNCAECRNKVLLNGLVQRIQDGEEIDAISGEFAELIDQVKQHIEQAENEENSGAWAIVDEIEADR